MMIKTGQTYAFPLHLLIPPYQPSGYYGVCRVVKIAADGAVLAGLDWCGQALPAIEQVARCGILHLSHAASGANPAIYWQADENPTPGFECLGTSNPSDEEIQLTTCTCKGRRCTCKRVVGGWKSCRAGLAREWRKRTDPAGYEADRALLRAMRFGHRQQAEAKRCLEVTQATLEGLRNETLFQSWENQLDPEIVMASQRIFSSSIEQLASLGKHASVAEQTAALQICIEQFNHLESLYRFIDTARQEVICHEFNRLAQAAGIAEPDLADRWREW